MFSKRSLIFGAGAAFIARPALALSSRCRGPFAARKIGPVNPQCLAVPNGLVGYWPLGPDTTDFHQGLTFDVSGNGATGTLVNSPTLAQGPTGGALSFVAGSSQDVNCGNIAALNSAVTASISGWMSPSGSSLIGFGSGTAAADRFGLFFLSGAVYFTYSNSGTSYASGTLTPAGATFYHLVGTFNGNLTGNNKVAFYVNGGAPAGLSYIGTAPATLPTLANSGNFLIGDNVTEGYSTGSLADVRLYNRALDPWEVLLLYKAGLAGSRTPYPGQKAI
jgi:hypothetical protein